MSPLPLLWEALPLGIIRADRAGRAIEANPAGVAVLGYPDAASLLATPLSVVFMLPSGPAAWPAEVERWLAADRGTVIQACRHDGQQILVKLRAAALADDSADLALIIEDVTAQAALEAGQRETESLYRTLVEQLPAIVYTYTYGTLNRTSYISPQIEKVLGFTPAEWLADADLWYKQVFPADRDRVIQALRQRDQDHRPFNMEYRAFTRDQRLVWFHNQNIVVRTPQGEPLYVHGVMFDITELKHREWELEALVTVANALRSASTRAELMTVLLAQILHLLDAGGAALAMREASDVFIELGLGERAGLTGRRLAPPAGMWGQVMATGQTYVSANAAADFGNVLPDWPGLLPCVACAPLIVQAQVMGTLEIDRATPFVPAEVRLLGIIADMAANALQSVTLYEQTRRHADDLEQRVAARTAELQAANTHLQTLSRLKDEFVSNVSHELRTPITSLKLYHDLLTSRPDRRDDYLSRLKRETNRLERLVEDVLRLSRMDRGQVTVTFAPVDLNALIALMVTDRQPMAESQGLTLTLESAPDLPRLTADQAMVGQAVSVLLTNALTYTPSGGLVAVRTDWMSETEQTLVGFSVRDTGPGIPPEEQSHLFQRFFRGAVGRRSGAPGTGLGLAIVREIVERHHGRVEFSSSGVPGEGTVFRVWLPVQQG